MDKSMQPEVSEEMHVQFFTLLPAYVNGTLADAEYQRVKKHLVQCIACKQEVETLQKLETVIQHQGSKTDWQPGPVHLQSIFDKIDAIEQPREDEKPVSIWQTIRNGLGVFVNSPAALRWTVVSQSALVVVLSVVIVVSMPNNTTPVNFQTFSSEITPANANNPHIRIVFSETMQLSELSSLLTDVSATLVEGPSSRGVFTIKLNSNHTDLAKTLGMLRENKHVDFAEVID
jgi:Putative zinc-finger